MPSFTLGSDDEAVLQNCSELSTHAVAVQCETNAVDAILCRRQPSHHERRGASANAEKVGDNFQSSESTQGLMRNAQGIDSRMLMMEDIFGMKSSNSWEDVPVDMISNGQSGSSSIGLAHKEVDQLRKWPERSHSNIPTWRLQEESCVKEADPEEEEEACVTPRAKEHCIPLEILICPPPPCKKRRSCDLSLPDGIKVRKRLSYAMPPSSASSSSASSPRYMDLQGHLYAAACQVVVNPPDLHTFPACIRALFFHD